MLDITYARASLRTIKSAERRTLNLDFKLDGSTVLNKVVFKTTSRLREYTANLEDQADEHWPIHQQVLTDARALHQEGIAVWIGKGHTRNNFRKGHLQESSRIQCTGCMIFELDDGSLAAQIYIDAWTLEIKLDPAEYQHFPFVGEYRAQKEQVTSQQGQWR